MFLNLEVVIAYWLAQRRSVEVMQYTLVVTVWRLATLLGAALYFREVEMIFITIVCAETLKNVGVYLWLRGRRLLVFRWDREAHARAGAPGGAAGPRLDTEQGQRVRPRGGGHDDGAGARWLSTPRRTTRCRW